MPFKLYVFCLLLFPFWAWSQEDLLSDLEAASQPEVDYVLATWKGTKVVNLQTNELPARGVLQYSILHRFGAFNDDFLYNFLGLDNAQVRLTLDYSPYNWLNLGLGHTGVRKTYDGYAKYRLLRQSRGKNAFPFSLTGFSALYYSAQRFNDDLPRNTSDRFSYVHELVIARKFTPRFSAQLVPTLIHFNVQPRRQDNNSVLALGLAARYKFTSQHAITLEYVPLLNGNTYLDPVSGAQKSYTNALSLGVDIETGGHVFHSSYHAPGVAEPYVFAQNTGELGNGDLHFGFNISRVFTIVKPRQFQE